MVARPTGYEEDTATDGIRGLFDQARGLTPEQRNAFIGAFLGWTMDAFDYFLIVFVFAQIAQEFGTSITRVTVATTLTLAARPVGALLFGLAADRYGRRIPLMVDVVFYSVVEFATGFSSSLAMLLVLRTLYGIGMGGEWGIGASLALEKLPPEKRGFFSRLFQEGYALGCLLAALLFFAVRPFFDWHALFFIGALPALLVLFSSGPRSANRRPGSKPKSGCDVIAPASATSSSTRWRCGVSYTSSCS